MRELIKKATKEAGSEPTSLDDVLFQMALQSARRSGAFKLEQLKRAAASNQTTTLINWLLSDKPLNRRQRIGLARLLAGDYKTKKGRKPLTLSQNREYDEMIREGRSRIAELAVQRSTTRDLARKQLALDLKMDRRAGDKTASTIERDLRSNPVTLSSRRKRGSSPKGRRLQKIRLK